MAKDGVPLKKGTLSFSVETRLLRELGERLVKQPDVAILELIKNAYDADAVECAVDYDPKSQIVVKDDGTGMTLDRFTNAWMRIGTSSKQHTPLSERFGRAITGEKGIGRFAVRFLGRGLRLESVADDRQRVLRTKLTATFDWPKFDRNEDLGKVKVPYRLVAANPEEPTGTKLTITRLRPEASSLDLQTVRTGSIGMVTPLRSLFRQTAGRDAVERRSETDPGFELKLHSDHDNQEADVAASVLEAFVLRATLSVADNKMDLKIYRRGVRKPYLRFVDTYANEVGSIEADIRFFPRRKGAFARLPVDGRRVSRWIKDNHGVAVFDRMFRVQPYGAPDDDWLRLQADAASNHRDPRSGVARKHFPMPDAVRNDTKENWMLRLPQSLQLVGVVCVNGRRADEGTGDGAGLIASADREGFVLNKAFVELWDLIRGAVESIAYADRRLQREHEAAERAEMLAVVRAETKSAVDQIEANPDITQREKSRLVAVILRSQELAEQQTEVSRRRERQLEIMSLLGVVAGFMTHEFGVAIAELEKAHRTLQSLTAKQPAYVGMAEEFEERIERLEEFVKYSTGYVHGARTSPKQAYLAKPRLRQVKRVFGKYAADRGIEVIIDVDGRLEAPLVPVSLYNGLALNLFTNALKAVTAKRGKSHARVALRARNDARWHYLEVSDTGIGIPTVLGERVFDPLFTTTASRSDPLGSGMGLGLTLVRRGAEAFGGRAEITKPAEGYATTVRVRLPLSQEGSVG